MSFCQLVTSMKTSLYGLSSNSNTPYNLASQTVIEETETKLSNIEAQFCQPKTVVVKHLAECGTAKAQIEEGDLFESDQVTIKTTSEMLSEISDQLTFHTSEIISHSSFIMRRAVELAGIC